MQMVGTKHDESKRPFLTVAKKRCLCRQIMQMVGKKKKNSPDAPGVPDQTCTYRFLAGRCSQKRAGRKRGHPPPLVVSAADTRAGDGWRRFFRNAPPDQTCTHL